MKQLLNIGEVLYNVNGSKIIKATVASCVQEMDNESPIMVYEVKPEKECGYLNTTIYQFHDVNTREELFEYMGSWIQSEEKALKLIVERKSIQVKSLKSRLRAEERELKKIQKRLSDITS